MAFSFFSRAQRTAVAAPAVQVVGHGTCSRTGCSEIHGWQCCYTDARGGTCQSWWCPEHAVLVGQTPFCPRHAPVARLLVSRVGSLFELPLPLVDDRSLPALLELTDRLDARIVRVLEHLYRTRSDVMTSPHANVRERRANGRHEAWEATWAATLGSGYLTSIAVRVSGSEPTAQLVRDGRTIAEGPLAFDPGMDAAGADVTAQRIYELLLATFTAAPLSAAG